MRQRVRELCKKKGVTLYQAEQDIGVAKGYLSKLDSSSPTAENLRKMADYFGVSANYILTGETGDEYYYLNSDAREYAQFLFDHPDYRVLFEASRNVKKEDLEIVKEILDRFSTN